MEVTRRRLLKMGALLMASGTIGKAAPNDRIAIGFIGAGVRGQELMDAVRKNVGGEVAGLCDAYTGRVERAVERSQNRPKVFKTHREMVADKSIDGVFVATPDHLHYPIVMDALRAGKDVYCETPLTYRAAEGLEMAKAASAGRRILQTGGTGISSDLQMKARTIINAGWLGTMTSIRAGCNRNTVDGAGIYPVPPDASPKTVNWEMFLGAAPKRPFSLERFFRWKCYQDYSVGIAAELFADICNSIHYLWDVPAPARVIAMGEIYRWGSYRDLPDTMNAILEYPRGFAVNLSASLSSNDDSFVQFTGTEGTLRLDAAGLSFEPGEPVEDHSKTVSTWPKSLEESYYRNSDVIKTEVDPAKEKKERELKEAEDKDDDDQKTDDDKITNPEHSHHFKDHGPDATLTHVGRFLEAVRTRKPIWEDAMAGHRAAACAHMINLSAREKRMVEWDFEKESIRT